MTTTESIIVRVNPAESTLGSLYPNGGIAFARKNIYAEGIASAREKSGGLLRLVFGVMPKSIRYNKVLTVNRMLFGIFLCLNGFVVGSQPLMAFSPIAVFSVIAGVLMICGLLTRISMIVSACVFAFMAFGVESSVMMPGADIAASLVSVMFAVMGPGRYSVDAMLRRNIFRYIRKAETRRIIAERTSYKAYHAFD